MKKIKILSLITAILLFILVFLNTFLFKKLDDCRVNKISTNQKVVMLTFDDGPGEADESILDILEENNVHATFFEVGTNIEKYHFTDEKFIEQHPYLKTSMNDSDSESITKVMKRIISSGSTIANHSLTHSKYNNNFKKLTNEIIETNLLIQEVYKENGISIDTNEIETRLPYLQYFPGVANAIRNAGISRIIEGYLGTDYNESNTGKNTILKQYETHLKKGIIYCCHTRDYAKEWLGDLIVWLREKGYNDFATFNSDGNVSYSYKNYGKLVY